MLKKLSLALSLIVTICFGLGLNASAQAAKTQVITTTDFYGEVAQEVLGSKGKVTSIINNPSTDPHDFEPTTKTAKQVAQADLVIYNGIGYDSWVKKLNGKKYLSVASLVGKKDGDNEHIWYDVPAMISLTEKLATYFSKKDAKNADYYQKNAQAYIKELKQLTTLETNIAKQAKGQKVAVSEPVFDYALASMGYKVANKHFAKATEDESDPSYSDIKKLQTMIKKKQIAFFVQNTQSDSKVIDNMAKLCQENDVPIVKVTETKPKGKTYVQWMTQEFKQVQKIQNN